MPKGTRNRDIRVEFWTNEQELQQIRKKMALCGMSNMSAYLRRMAMKGYVLSLDLPELRELVSLLRRYSNNTNQIAKRVNETGRFYAADIEEMLQKQEDIWTAVNDILLKLADVE